MDSTIISTVSICYVHHYLHNGLQLHKPINKENTSLLQTMVSDSRHASQTSLLLVQQRFAVLNYTLIHRLYLPETRGFKSICEGLNELDLKQLFTNPKFFHRSRDNFY